MFIARFALRHTKLAHALFLILSAAGVIAWLDLPIEVYPPVRAARAVVETVWPGASTAEVERFVTTKLEERIEGLRYVDWFRSESTANLSVIVIRFEDRASAADIESAIATLRSRVQEIRDLPESCETPVVRRVKLDEDDPFLRICVSDRGGEGPVALLRAARDLQEGLAEIPGVSGVRLQGAGEPEIRVLADRDALEDNRLSVPEVAGVLRRSALSIPVGSLESEHEVYPIRFGGDIESLDQLGDVIIRKDPTGAHVYLREIAAFEEALSRDFVLARFHGDRSIVVEVTKTSGSNIMRTRDAVLDHIEQFKLQNTERHFGVDVAVDITPWISNALTVMQQNLLAGCILVLLVLGLFLGVRNSILAMIGIPFSFLCTLICMSAMGITLNTASVFAMVLVSGLIVDDAIVVLENIHRHMQSDVSRTEAIVRGVSEVMAPVCTAALTTVVAFLPILLIRGGIGSLFTVVPKIVTIALLASLFECLIILPGHILDWGGGKRTEKRISRRNWLGVAYLRRAFEKSGEWLTNLYIGCLTPLLRLRYLVAVLLVALLVLLATARQAIRVETLPAEFPMAVINFETLSESSLDETDRIAKRLGEALDELSGEQKLIQNYIISSGMQFTDQRFAIQQPNLGMIWVQFNPTSLARKDPEALLSLLRDTIRAHVDAHDDVGLESFTVSAMGTGLEATEAVVVRVEHRDLNVCRTVANQLGQRLGEMPGVTGIGDSLRRGPLQLSLRAREPQCSEFGLTQSDIALSVRAATEGVTATRLREPQEQDERPVRVLLAQRWRSELGDLLEVPLKTPTGAAPRLEEVAEPYYEQHYASLHHNNGRPSIVVSAAIEGKPKDAQGQPIDVGYVYRQLRDDFQRFQDQHPGLTLTMGGGYAQRQEAFGQLRLAGLLAAMLIYLILLAQFRSYLQPFLVLLTLLFSFMGVIAGLAVHEYAFSVVSAVALVGLFGVAVNDAIILIDFINKVPRGSADRLQPVLEGCRLRLRPIVVTTVTTVAGLLPMAIGLRGYSSIWSPFAACFCYGLMSATLLTLVMMPCFYLICEDLGRAPSWLIRCLLPVRASPHSNATEER